VLVPSRRANDILVLPHLSVLLRVGEPAPADVAVIRGELLAGSHLLDNAAARPPRPVQGVSPWDTPGVARGPVLA